jgi:hypothetical protein
MTRKDVLDAVWDNLQAEITSVQKQVDRQSVKTEVALSSDAIPAYLFADLPTIGLADGSAGSYISLAWVTNGRKSGEGVGAGTGVLAIYNAVGNNWLRVGDYTVVAI